MNERLTFIIPVYNGEATVRRTIDSVLRQTDSNWKMVLVNDGSQDGSGEICRQYAEEYPHKIAYISQENRGLGGARNSALKIVDTEYVAFLDSDDWLMPEFTECILGQIKRYGQGNKKDGKGIGNECNGIEMILVLPEIYHEGSRTVRDWYDKELFDKIFAEDGDVINPQKEQRVYQLEVNQCRKILQMDFVRRIGFSFREQIKWEDVVPHFYLFSKCTSCMGIPSVGFYYRVGGYGQITSLRGKERLDILAVFEDLVGYLSQERRHDLEFPAMRVMVRFSVWCIRSSNPKIRKRLVKELHSFFKKLPKSFYSGLKKGCKQGFPKADQRQYRLFMTAIKYRVFNFIFYDYLYQDIGEKLIKKVLGAKERVE